MSKENSTYIVAERNGKVRQFSKSTWDLLPVGKMGYSLVKDLPELKDSKKEVSEEAKGKTVKEPKHAAFKKKDDKKAKKAVEETPEKVSENVSEELEENFKAADPLLD